MVRWVIQNNLSAEGGDFHKMAKACEELGITYEGIQVIPFSPDIPEHTKDDKINIYYGATTLMYNIYHQHNKPVGLFFDEEKFSIENYMKVWGEYMLNSEARVTTFKEFAKENHLDDELFFTRPDADDKSFCGDVRTFAEMKTMLSNMTIPDNVILTEDTKIIVSTPWNIKNEWRNYIVDGKVVTSSMYRKNFRLHKDGNDIPEDMIKFVEDRCKEYMPHACFAMDIALCGDEYYIIECGCLNSVGLYHSDVKKMIEAVTNYIEKKYLGWNTIIEDDYSTYPEEGEEVLISDGKKNYDVAYFLMSGDYKWVKVHVANDDISDFDSFNPIKWKQIK